MSKSWYGFDLDGTLAYYPPSVGYIGEPIFKMVEKLKEHLRSGDSIRIVTARVCSMYPERDKQANRSRIDAWCIFYFGQTFPITAEKDYDMVRLYDERAVEIVHNLGITRSEYDQQR